MEINSYADYIIEKLELYSIVMIAATLFIFMTFGWFIALLPCVVFHAVAYVRYKQFIKDRSTERIKANQAEYLRNIE